LLILGEVSYKGITPVFFPEIIKEQVNLPIICQLISPMNQAVVRSDQKLLNITVMAVPAKKFRQRRAALVDPRRLVHILIKVNHMLKLVGEGSKGLGGSWQAGFQIYVKHLSQVTVSGIEFIYAVEITGDKTSRTTVVILDIQE